MHTDDIPSPAQPWAPALSMLPRGRPARSGQPWLDEDYEQLLELVREGHDVDDIANTIGRSHASVQSKVKALLPPEVRGAPSDRHLPALRAELTADRDYPWDEVILQMPPPAPVVTQVIKRAGVAGLDDDELVVVAQALLTGCDPDSPTVESVVREVRDRRLVERVTASYVRSLLVRLPPVTPDEAAFAASRLFEIVLDGETSRASDHCPPWSSPYADPWR